MVLEVLEPFEVLEALEVAPSFLFFYVTENNKPSLLYIFLPSKNISRDVYA